MVRRPSLHGFNSPLMSRANHSKGPKLELMTIRPTHRTRPRAAETIGRW